jgi:hypothetical protein
VSLEIVSIRESRHLFEYPALAIQYQPLSSRHISFTMSGYIPNTTSSLPQGFSVYQPSLGAPLEFLPALGTPQLDELINAFIPGHATIQEKRATVSLGFLEYAQMTGQTFKFYPVFAPSPPASSPISASPAQESAASSFHPSPMTPTWDWSRAPSVSSARSSTQHSKAHRSTPVVSRHAPNDVNSLPGMKILTKDGVDVTNSAGRGSKSKEQRAHAHLMRVMKACDQCRRRKSRCDPSHKRAAAAGSSTSSGQPLQTAKPARQAPSVQAAPPPQRKSVGPPSIADQGFPVSVPSFDMDLDASMAFPETNGWGSFDASQSVWDEFIQIPDEEIPDDLDFFFDSNAFASPQSFSSLSGASSSTSSDKVSTPASSGEEAYAAGAPRAALAAMEPIAAQGEAPFIYDVDGADLADSYTDFNLYSPQSSFSEDEHMISVRSFADDASAGAQALNPSLIETDAQLPWTDSGTYFTGEDEQQQQQQAFSRYLGNANARLLVGESSARLGHSPATPANQLHVSAIDGGVEMHTAGSSMMNTELSMRIIGDGRRVVRDQQIAGVTVNHSNSTLGGTGVDGIGSEGVNHSGSILGGTGAVGNGLERGVVSTHNNNNNTTTTLCEALSLHGVGVMSAPIATSLVTALDETTHAATVGPDRTAAAIVTDAATQRSIRDSMTSGGGYAIAPAMSRPDMASPVICQASPETSLKASSSWLRGLATGTMAPLSSILAVLLWITTAITTAITTVFSMLCCALPIDLVGPTVRALACAANARTDKVKPWKLDNATEVSSDRSGCLSALCTRVSRSVAQHNLLPAPLCASGL